jgi:hypothetical protein
MLSESPGVTRPRCGQLDIGQSLCQKETFVPFTIDRPWIPLSGSEFIPKLISRKGRRLPRVSRLRNRVAGLFYSIPEQIRRTKVREWFSSEYHIPKYLFRLSGRCLSDRQKIVSTIFRTYNAYVFNLRGINPSRAVRHAADGSLHQILSRMCGRSWYATCEVAYRRLKVLLSPYRR